MSALLDTGFLLAVLDADDEYHESCTSALLSESDSLLPDVVIPELAYLILRELGYSVLTVFLNSILAGELVIEPTQRVDLARTVELLEKYADSRVDFVDCVIVAMAERLGIQRVLTVDRRHFALFQPKHCPYFVIAP